MPPDLPRSRPLPQPESPDAERSLRPGERHSADAGCVEKRELRSAIFGVSSRSNRYDWFADCGSNPPTSLR